MGRRRGYRNPLALVCDRDLPLTHRMMPVPFRYVKHFVTVPVTVGDLRTTFAIDTGVGITCVSNRLAERAGWDPTGATMTGRRMSGQEITGPLGRLPPIRLGDHAVDVGATAIFDIAEVAGLEDIEGFLGLDGFTSTPLTFDYPRKAVLVEDAASLSRRSREGISVEVRVELEEHLAEAFLSLSLPHVGPVEVEVDTGSSQLILDEGVARAAGADLGPQAVRRIEGTDETGYRYIRYFGSLQGQICVTGQPALSQEGPAIMAQQIIYQGLVGDDFLSRFVVTYDLSRARMIFRRP